VSPRPDVVALDVTAPRATRTIALVWLADVAHPAPARAFRDAVLGYRGRLLSPDSHTSRAFALSAVPRRGRRTLSVSGGYGPDGWWQTDEFPGVRQDVSDVHHPRPSAGDKIDISYDRRYPDRVVLADRPAGCESSTEIDRRAIQAAFRGWEAPAAVVGVTPTFLPTTTRADKPA